MNQAHHMSLRDGMLESLIDQTYTTRKSNMLRSLGTLAIALWLGNLCDNYLVALVAYIAIGVFLDDEPAIAIDAFLDDEPAPTRQRKGIVFPMVLLILTGGTCLDGFVDD